MPARINSVFLTVTLSWAARCFMASSTKYSALGMVTLSRTIFGFLSLAGLLSATAAVTDGAAAGLALATVGTADWGLATVFAAAERTGDDFLAAPARLAAGVRAGAVLVLAVRFFAAGESAGVFAGTALAVGAACAEVVAVLVMVLFPCVCGLKNGTYSLYRFLQTANKARLTSALRNGQAGNRCFSLRYRCVLVFDEVQRPGRFLPGQCFFAQEIGRLRKLLRPGGRALQLQLAAGQGCH